MMAKKRIHILLAALESYRPEQTVPAGLMSNIDDLLREICNFSENRGLRESLLQLRNRLEVPLNVVDLRKVLNDLETTLEQYPHGLVSEDSAMFEDAWRFERIERELVSLKETDPGLEKKVSDLEEEVRKLRTASMSADRTEKEQKDMLKEYREASRKVFVIMPFEKEFSDVWVGAIYRACTTEKFACLKIDQVSLSTWITDDIKQYIEAADVVIADISGSNPNVMFELGWALAKGKSPIVIRNQDTPNPVPFDVRDIRYISYMNSWSGIETLSRNISKFLKSTSAVLNSKSEPRKKQE
jgi:hypothetical protein